MAVRDVVDRFWEMFETNGLDRLEEIWTDDTEFTMPGGSFRGPDAMRAMCAGWLAAFPDMRHELIDVIESEDTVAVELRMVGTHTGTMLPTGTIPPTGRRVDMPSADYIKVRDGKIVSWHAYPDMLALLGQLGVMQSAGQAAPLA